MSRQTSSRKKLRIAAVGDLHYTKHSQGKLQQIFTEASAQADVLLLCGDLTDYGLAEEARILAADLRSHLHIPAIAVLGNHDFEAGQQAEIEQILYDAGVPMLDGECHTVSDVGFAGVCGFGGGFGSRMLNAWGEPIIKAFVQEAVDQSLRLEKALGRLDTEKKVAILHYAPIRETVVGESEEIFPYLGSSRLESPLNRFAVDVVFHGHAHAGTLAGATSSGAPVYNVALPLLEKTQPGRGFYLVEV